MKLCQPKNFRKMFREIMAIRTSQMMTLRSLICLLENQNGGKLQKRSLKHARFFGHDGTAGVFEIEHNQ
jgi:hypothetical protein